jgi:hypothetical protein
MISVSGQQLIEDVCGQMGWDPNDLDVRQWADMRQAIARSLKQWWEAYWWPDVMETRRLAFHPTHVSGATYSGEDKVWFPSAGGYYMALTVTTTAPATYAAGEWTTGTDWFKLEDGYTAEELDEAASYAAGEVAARDDRIWVSKGAAPGQWPGAWIELPLNESLIPTVDDGRPPIGRVRTVSKCDPRRYDDPGKYEFKPVAGGVRVSGIETNVPWVEYRLVAPQITGNHFDAAAMYAAAPANEQIYG